jgi:hypothetical protein
MKMVKACTVPVFAAWLGLVALAAQPPTQQEEIRLPSGKLQREEILKAEHEKSLKDAAEIVRLAEALKAELEKNDYHVLSLASIKKTEEIERLARRIKSRLRRF